MSTYEDAKVDFAILKALARFWILKKISLSWLCISIHFHNDVWWHTLGKLHGGNFKLSLIKECFFAIAEMANLFFFLFLNEVLLDFLTYCKCRSCYKPWILTMFQWFPLAFSFFLSGFILQKFVDFVRSSFVSLPNQTGHGYHLRKGHPLPRRMLTFYAASYSTELIEI